MKSGTSTLAMLLLGLGLALLAGDSRAQTQQENSQCIANMISRASGREGKAMVPIVMRMMGEFKRRGGPKKVMEKMESMIKICACSEENPEATDTELCQCTEEITECDMMHKPNSTTAPEEIKGKITSLMDCLGDARMSRIMGCQETMLMDPTQMVCSEKKELTCTQE